MSTPFNLVHSRALWNRQQFDLASNEVLAQLLDRGEIEAWAELYRLARNDPQLRRRILALCQTVPLPFPHFWIAAMSALGEPVSPYPKVAEPRDDL